MAHVVLEIRWRLQIDDGEASFNFELKSFYILDIKDTPVMNFTSSFFGELIMGSEITTRILTEK